MNIPTEPRQEMHPGARVRRGKKGSPKKQLGDTADNVFKIQIGDPKSGMKSQLLRLGTGVPGSCARPDAELLVTGMLLALC